MAKPIVSKKEQLFDEATCTQKLLGTFFRQPNRDFTLSEIAKEARISKSTASRLLANFGKYGIIKITPLGKNGHVLRIRANYENPLFRYQKIAYNLTTVYSGRIVEFLNEAFGHPKTIVLFGSFRSGEDTTGSDIDIAIETAGDRELQVLRLKELEAFESQTERQVKVHVFNRKHIDLNLFNNIANGIVLSGFLEVNK